MKSLLYQYNYACATFDNFELYYLRFCHYLLDQDELKRGDVPKSIQCYMHETGASEVEARQHIWELIDATWKKINEERIAQSPNFPHTFIQIAVNFPRMAHCVYQHGDGHGIGYRETKDSILSLIVFPIP